MKSSKLEELILNALKKHQETAEGKNTLSSEHDEFLTRKETAKRLKISLPTLNAYSNAGILPRHYLGNRVLYKASEIEKAPQKASYGNINKKGDSQ